MRHALSAGTDSVVAPIGATAITTWLQRHRGRSAMAVSRRSRSRDGTASTSTSGGSTIYYVTREGARLAGAGRKPRSCGRRDAKASKQRAKYQRDPRAARGRYWRNVRWQRRKSEARDDHQASPRPRAVRALCVTRSVLSPNDLREWLLRQVVRGADDRVAGRPALPRAIFGDAANGRRRRERRALSRPSVLLVARDALARTETGAVRGCGRGRRLEERACLTASTKTGAAGEWVLRRPARCGARLWRPR